MPGLEALSDEYTRLTGEASTAFTVAFAVRQVYIAEGCHHACRHCFASPPVRSTVMDFDGFRRLAAEFGHVATKTGRSFEFLFLGSATDPSAVPRFARFLHMWMAALPPHCLTRLYTHGWLLGQPGQRDELDALLDVLVGNLNRIEMINISVDAFSRLARSNWSEYVRNGSENLEAFLRVVPTTLLRLHVLYPISRYTRGAVSNQALIVHWKEHLEQDAQTDFAHILATINEAIRSEEDAACAELTRAVLEMGHGAGLSVAETLLMARDAGIPMPAGRGRSLFLRSTAEVQSTGLDWYRRKALVRLTPTETGSYPGVHIFPDGRARIIDYDGYRLGPWLAEGRPVVQYLSPNNKPT